MTDACINRATPAVADALSALALRAKSHWGYSRAQLAAWHGELTVSAGSIRRWPTYVAERGDELAGFYQLRPGPWSLEHLWVDPQRMGCGIGRLLLEHALRQVAAGGGRSLHIDADPHAEGFYLACGAERVGAVPAPTDELPARGRPQLRLAVTA